MRMAMLFLIWNYKNKIGEQSGKSDFVAFFMPMFFVKKKEKESSFFLFYVLTGSYQIKTDRPCLTKKNSCPKNVATEKKESLYF